MKRLHDRLLGICLDIPTAVDDFLGHIPYFSSKLLVLLLGISDVCSFGGINSIGKELAVVLAQDDVDDDLETKKEIFFSLGSDLILKDKMLSISWDNLLFPIQAMAKEVHAIRERLEPEKDVAVAKDLAEIYDQNPRMLRDLDSNQDSELQRLVSYH